MSGKYSLEFRARARKLWDEGVSAAAIGRALNISKNAVIGLSHRLDFPRHPTLIGRTGKKHTKPDRAPKDTLPPLSVPAFTLPPLLTVAEMMRESRPPSHGGLRVVLDRAARPRAAALVMPVEKKSEPSAPTGGVLYASAEALGCCHYVVDARRNAQRVCGGHRTQGIYCRRHWLVCHTVKDVAA